MTDPKKIFNQMRRRYLDTPLKTFGFKKYKTSHIARLTEGNVFQFLNFQKSAYGSTSFTINVAIRPLSCPNNSYLILAPGNRLEDLASGKRGWWDYPTEEIAETSFKEIFSLIEKYAIPFFDSTKSAKEILKSYEDNKFENKIGWGTIGWENYDFGHIYLQDGNVENAIKQFTLAYNEFIKDERDWAQAAAKECLEIKNVIKRGHPSIDKYLTDTLEESKVNLKLTNW